MEEFVAVEGLVKDYPGRGRAVAGLSFGVRPGEVYGLLGPNGAGKTTTVRVVVAMLPATSGVVRVGGFDVARSAEEVRRLVGYAAQGTGVDIDLTVHENLVLRARLHGLGRHASLERAATMIERFGLGDFAKQRAGFASGGQRRRLDIALALVHEPKLVVLDEPTTGLDPQARRALWSEIDGLSGAGTTVLLTTQQLEEADRLCQRVGIIDGGVMVAEGAPAALRAAAGDQTVVFEFASLDDRTRARVERIVRRTPGASTPVVAGASVSVSVEDPVPTIAAILQGLTRAHIDVASMRAGTPSLEDVYLRLTGDAQREDTGVTTGATSVGVALGVGGGRS